MLIVISGPSGSGKGTIIKEVMERNKDLIYSVSYTTRPKRAGEVDGKDYFFISNKKFEKLIKKNFFIEWARVYNYYYGTSKDFVIENLKKGKDIIL
ncbi:MAG: guanylate kinase, partial [Caldisericia bacterium]|nr:guanylate kinase [Caldisericia bacterium]